MQYIIRKRKSFYEKNNKCGIFSLVFVMKLGGRFTEIYSVELQKTGQGPEDQTEFITMLL